MIWYKRIVYWMIKCLREYKGGNLFMARETIRGDSKRLKLQIDYLNYENYILSLLNDYLDLSNAVLVGITGFEKRKNIW